MRFRIFAALLSTRQRLANFVDAASAVAAFETLNFAPTWGQANLKSPGEREECSTGKASPLSNPNDTHAGFGIIPRDRKAPGALLLEAIGE